MSSRFAASIFLASIPWIPAAHGQVHELWSHTHDGSVQGEDYCVDVAVDIAGNVYVTGQSKSMSPTGGAFVMGTLAYDAAGNQLWNQDYSSPLGGDDFATVVALSPQGDVYVAGTSRVNAPPNVGSRQTLVKYTAGGALIWARQYGTASPLGANAVSAMLIDPQGNVILGGSEAGTSGDLCVRKIDPAGNVVWTAVRDGSAHGVDGISAISLAANGDVIAVGTTYPLSGLDSNIAVMRVDASGTVLWEREIDSGFSDTDRGNDVAVDALGNAYVVGTFDVLTQGDDTNQALIALDPAGTTLWSRNLDGGSGEIDGFSSVRVDPFGRIVTAGYATNAGSTDASVTVFDSNGGMVWKRTFDAQMHGDDICGGIEFDSLGDIYVAGSSATTVGLLTHFRAIALEYDPSGEMRCFYSQPAGTGLYGEIYSKLVIAPDSSINLVGYGDGGAGGSFDYIVARLERTSTPFCFGDGSGTACPCGNSSAAVTQSGCSSSLGLGGRLIDSGASSLSADTFVLNGTSMPSSSCLYFQGTSAVAGGAGSVFGDGLRCAGGTVVRLSTKQNVSGQSRYPVTGDPSVSVRGNVTSPGDRTYQVWFRNAAPFCTSSTFNLTNGLRVTWVP